MLKVPWCVVCARVRERRSRRESAVDLAWSPRKVTVTGCRCVWVPGDPGTSASCFGILLTCFPSSWLGIGIHYLQPPNSESIYSFNPIYKWLWVKYCKGSKWNTSGEKRECGPVHTVSCMERQWWRLKCVESTSELKFFSKKECPGEG